MAAIAPGDIPVLKAYEDGSCVILTHIRDDANTSLTPSLVSTGGIVYTLTQLINGPGVAGTSVVGHTAVALNPPSSYIETSVVTTKGWDTNEDASGWNFRHSINIGTSPAFAESGLYEYMLVVTPNNGSQPCKFVTYVNVTPVAGS